MYNDKFYYFLKIVDPIKTDWEIATLPRYYVFTGDQSRYSASELLPIQTKDLKKAQKNNTLDKLMASDTMNENAEMSQSDITKIIDYSEKLQSMFSVNDNLEDWVKAKLNHACDYVATVRDYLKFYHDEKEAGTSDDQINEKWSMNYKKRINCSNPKGFSQKAHCRARKLRQSGRSTKSKPVKEIYKEVTSQLLK
jgi:alpha-L-fucosidase